MSEEDRSYFEARAEQELRMARAAQNPEAARAHASLAAIYLERLDRGHGQGCRAGELAR